MRLLIDLMHFALLFLAVAVTATIGDDGAVTGTTVVASTPDVVRSKVGDPAWVATIGGAETDVIVAAVDGDCQVLDYVSHHAIATARYRVKQCPSADGFVANLVESDAFSFYRTSWSVIPADEGTRLLYRIELVSTLPVPKWIVRRSTRSSVEHMMESIAKAL